MNHTNKFHAYPDIGPHTDCYWREMVKRFEIWMGMDEKEIVERLHRGDLSLKNLLREADECGLGGLDDERE